MSFILPFEGHLVAPEWAGAVVAPLHDSLTAEERRRHADAFPHSFLNAMRSADESPSGHPDGVATSFDDDAAFLRRCIEEGKFLAQPACAFVYRLSSPGHVQRGVVAEMPVDAYLDGRVKRHEFTRIALEDAIAAYIDHVRAASSPVCLAYRADDGVRDRLDAVTRAPPTVSHAAEDGVAHDIWKLEGDDATSLLRAFDRVPGAYLTDGHHRCAATARFSTAGADVRVLVALFPDDELRILPFHRVVRDLGPHTAESFIDRLREDFVVERLPPGEPAAARPRGRGEFAVHVDGGWFRFRLVRGEEADGEAAGGGAVGGEAVGGEAAGGGAAGAETTPASPAEAIDAAILQARVLGPVLGIADPRDDERLDYLAGSGGLEDLECACRTGGWRAAFALHPTSMEELVTVADAGEVMPPKSTWFHPKPRSGFFLHDPLRRYPG